VAIEILVEALMRADDGCSGSGGGGGGGVIDSMPLLAVVARKGEEMVTKTVEVGKVVEWFGGA
jgi:hypothetical protein